MTARPEARVAAVVPTLNRVGDLRRLVEALHDQTLAPDWVIVVDNGSTDGTGDYLSAQAGLTPVRPGANLGAPGGFDRGMREGFARGARWAWLLDDDCLPDREALECLMARIDEEGAADVGGAVPTVRFGDGRGETGWLWGTRAAGGSGQSPNVPAGGRAPAAEVDWAPFAGLLLEREACQRAGPVRTDFVLWHADVEYCLRLRAGHRRLLAAPRAEVWHPEMPVVERRVLGRTVRVGRLPPWREFYDTRNRTVLMRGVDGTDLAYGVPVWRRAVAELARAAAVVVADPQGVRRIAMRMLGLIDGVRGRMDRRPELERM